MKIGIYVRVSSEEQKLNGVSVNDQKQRGIDFCTLNDYDYELYSDAGKSGTLGIDERPALSKMLEDIITKDIEGIYVTDFDRLSRNQDLSFLLRTTFIEENIKLFDVSGEVNLNDETQSLLVGIKILLADFEIKKLKTRIKRALERNVIDGKVGGGALIPLGYDKDENKMLIVDPVESEVIKTIFKLSIKGFGTKKIADYLTENGVPTKRGFTGVGLTINGEKKTDFQWRDSVVYSILSNPLYQGLRRYKGQLYECPSIVSKDDWELVQSLMKKKKNTKDTTNKYFYLLKGLLFCSKCGRRMYGRKRKDLSDNQYICSSQRYQGEFCGNRGINIDKIEKIVWNSLMKLPHQMKHRFNYESVQLDPELNKKKEMYEKFLTDIETKRKRLVKLLIDGTIDESMIKPELEELNKRKDSYVYLLNYTDYEINNKHQSSSTIRTIEEQLEEIKKLDLTDVQKKNIVQSFIKKIFVEWKHETHRVTIEYGLSNSSFSHIENTIDINYKKKGWRFEESNIEYSVNAITRNVDSSNDGEFLGNIFISYNDKNKISEIEKSLSN